MKRYQNWAKRESTSGKQVLTLVLAGLLIVGIIPFLVVVASLSIDRWLHIPDFYTGVINLIAGLILAIVGLGLGLWSIQAQLTIGMGTPVPLLPTQKLVVRAPFIYCRNPMTLGTIVAYLGIGVWIGSFSALVLALILGSLLLLYIKLLEEKELEARFGGEYLAYKRSTPFIFPRKPRG